MVYLEDCPAVASTALSHRIIRAVGNGSHRFAFPQGDALSLSKGDALSLSKGSHRSNHRWLSAVEVSFSGGSASIDKGFPL
jgi:hypothetical protein